jgi:environmental stress-induced protein Ves
MHIRVLGPNDFVSMPWRNGRGTTLELCREDDAAGAMLWRLSEADVVADGPFSPFPGVDRVLLLKSGAGFDLDFGDFGRVAPVERLVPVRFSGDWPARAENVRGPSRDINVMVARGKAGAEVSVVRESVAGRLADRAVFLAVEGHWDVVIDDGHWGLAEGEVLVATAKGQPGKVSGNGVVLWIDISLSGAS